ncbi:MAG: hypothetical protein ACW98I_17475 [Candidatus Hodarchaeales archaeon]
MVNRLFTSFSVYGVLILGVLCLFPLTQVSAGVVWTEDWETGLSDEWIIDAYSYELFSGFQPYELTTPSVVAGVFKTNAPTSAFLVYWSGVHRNSTVAFGTWSFDWVVEPGVDHESYVDVFFMVNNYKDNITGEVVFGDTPGYVLNLQSGFKGPLTANSITLARAAGGGLSQSALGIKVFASEITGSHHIEVSRSSDGEFTVAFDSTVELTATDTNFNTSEKFVIGAWIGDSGFDNITTSDLSITTTTTTTTTLPTTTESATSTTAAGGPGFELQVLVLGLSLFFVYTRKRRP